MELFFKLLPLLLATASPTFSFPDTHSPLQSFQRIQRTRQSRIRVKLCRKAGKRADEVLEEDIAAPEEDIDIVGVEKKEAAEEEAKKKASLKLVTAGSLYGPEQFTEEDVLTVANKLEEKEAKEHKVEAGVEEVEKKIAADDIKKEEEGGEGGEKWCSQCQVQLRVVLEQFSAFSDRKVNQSKSCFALANLTNCSCQHQI